MKFEIVFRELTWEEQMLGGPDRPIDKEGLEMYFRAFAEDVGDLPGVVETSMPNELCLHVLTENLAKRALMELMKPLLSDRADYHRYFRIKFDENNVVMFRQVS